MAFNCSRSAWLNFTRYRIFIAATSKTAEVGGEAMNHNLSPGLMPPSPPFTEKQGQYLAFIYAYSQVRGCAPAEAELQRHFQVTAPTVHQMVLALERLGLTSRQPGVARSIRLLVEPEALPILRSPHCQSVKSPMPRY